MFAVQYDRTDPSFPASLVELEPPALPGSAWARVAVTVGGICGSDLHLFSHNVGPTPALYGIGTFPFLLGHEIAGQVIESGPDCPVAPGTRVALNPTVTCEARGLPLCPSCARGWVSSCLNLDSHAVTPGRSLGYTSGLGGGWAEQAVAHRSMLFPLPDGVSDEGASLHEPLSIAAHGLLRQPPADGDPILIVGAGIIGLAALAAVRGMYPQNEVTVLARHEHQAQAATRCGAHHVVRSQAGSAHFQELAALAGARVLGRRDELMLMSGFPYVIEAVGAPRAVTEALRSVAHRGVVLLLGAAGVSEVDLSPVWYKEAALVGSIDHAVDAGGAPGVGGAPNLHSVQRAVELLAAGLLPHEAVVTHRFGLPDYRDAIETAIDRGGAHAIKVVFNP
jgi:threonine dehydrogenase-like Zn-dependent dehydrogenase